MAKLSHLDRKGRARMVDVSAKLPTKRRAVAEAFVRLAPSTLALLAHRGLPKGDAIETCRLAGVMAAKKTPELIPLCHPLPLTHADIAAEICEEGVRLVATVSCTAVTGVEMEAMTAASVAALTQYDMVKAVQRDAVIERVRLLEKTGGKSDLRRKPGR